MSLQLSESLYPVDEVVGTFIQCLLMNASLDECLFWLWELIYTTPNICEGIVSIYQQFYSHTNSNVGRYVTRKLEDYCETGEKRHLADIVDNLRNLSSNPTAYYIVKYSQLNDVPDIIYKRRKWMRHYPSNMFCLLGSLNACDVKNIGLYVASSLRVNGFLKTRDALILYASIKGKDIDTGLCDAMCDCDIITLACLISKIMNRNELPKNKFARSNMDAVLKMESHFEKTPTRHYRNLTERRLYPTHSFLPPLNYGRFAVEHGFDNACRLHWEYYSFTSIEWNKHFNRCGGYLDHIKRQVVWSSDETMESFYNEGRCIDFDEQPIDAQTMSLHPIHVVDDPREWYESIILNKLSQLSI